MLRGYNEGSFTVTHAEDLGGSQRPSGALKLSYEQSTFALLTRIRHKVNSFCTSTSHIRFGALKTLYPDIRNVGNVIESQNCEVTPGPWTLRSHHKFESL